jgi:hypothetical protein
MNYNLQKIQMLDVLKDISIPNWCVGRELFFARHTLESEWVARNGVCWHEQNLDEIWTEQGTRYTAAGIFVCMVKEKTVQILRKLKRIQRRILDTKVLSVEKNKFCEVMYIWNF